MRPFLTVSLPFLLLSCAELSEFTIMGMRVIDICTEEYTRLSGSQLHREVDRAYILAIPGKYDVLFTRGEVGTFGERSESHRAYLSCGVLVSDTAEIYFLSEPLRDPLVYVQEEKQVTESAPLSGIREQLFLRRNGEFHFFSEQSFNPDKMQIESSTILD